MNNDPSAIKKAILAVLFWSTVATAFKIALDHQSLLQLLSIASLTTLILLTCIVTFKPSCAVAFKPWHLVAALFNPIVYYLILFKAYQLLPAQIAQPVNYTWAFSFVILARVFLKHKITKADLTAMTIAYAGVLTLSLQGGQFSISLLGLSLALLSTLVWAGYWILNGKYSTQAVGDLWWQFVIAAPILALSFIWSPLEISAIGISSAIYIGLFEMGISFILWSSAVSSISNINKISNLIFLSPIFSIFFIYFLLGETIYWTTFFGLFLIICGLWWQQQSQRPAQKQTSA